MLRVFLCCRVSFVRGGYLLPCVGGLLCMYVTICKNRMLVLCMHVKWLTQ